MGGPHLQVLAQVAPPRVCFSLRLSCLPARLINMSDLQKKIIQLWFSKCGPWTAAAAAAPGNLLERQILDPTPIYKFWEEASSPYLNKPSRGFCPPPGLENQWEENSSTSWPSAH